MKLKLSKYSRQTVESWTGERTHLTLTSCWLLLRVWNVSYCIVRLDLILGTA